MKKVLPLCTVLLMMAAHVPALAQSDDRDPAAPPPIPPVDAAPRVLEEDVPIPPKVINEEDRLEPTVEISRDADDNLVEEYSLDGRVYMVKITPKRGVPYYYLDEDGDGQLEIQERDRAANPVRPVFWKIKEWD